MDMTKNLITQKIELSRGALMVIFQSSEIALKDCQCSINQLLQKSDFQFKKFSSRSTPKKLPSKQKKVKATENDMNLSI